jgi:sulfotransferase family protein
MVAVNDFDRFIFIVGAPRCGTTTLSRFLKGHPSISFPAVKEPHFFAQNDLCDLPDDELKARVEGEYLQRLFHTEPDRRVGVDASVTYFYAPEQLEPALRLWPDSRFVIALRDPLTMLPSLHKRLIYVGEETITKFADAWAASPDRAAGRRIPRTCHEPKFLRYDEAARFGTYLERLFAVVGRDRCLVVIFDDLVADPAEQYRRLMEFTGLAQQPGIDFSRRRQGYSVRFPWLQRLLKRPPRAIAERLVGNLSQQPGRNINGQEARRPGAILSLRKRVLRWNRVSHPSQPLPLALRNEIRLNFKDEVERAGRLLGRDLSHWLQPAGDSCAATTDYKDGATGRCGDAFSH